MRSVSTPLAKGHGQEFALKTGCAARGLIAYAIACSTCAIFVKLFALADDHQTTLIVAVEVWLLKVDHMLPAVLKKRMVCRQDWKKENSDGGVASSIQWGKSLGIESQNMN